MDDCPLWILLYTFFIKEVAVVFLKNGGCYSELPEDDPSN